MGIRIIGGASFGSLNLLEKSGVCELTIPTPTLGESTIAKAKAIYGNRLLVAGYSGPAYTLVRTSDSASLDVYFQSNGRVDENAILTWAGASVARVATWYDQSGNGRDLTQSTHSSRPIWNKLGRSGEVGGVQLAGGAVMNFPSGLATDARNVSVIHVLRVNDTQPTNDSGIMPAFQLGTENATGCIAYGGVFSSISPTPFLGDRMQRRDVFIGGLNRTSGSVQSFRPSNVVLSAMAERFLTTECKFRQGSRETTSAQGNAFSGTGGTWGRAFNSAFTSPSAEAHCLLVSSAYTDEEEDAAMSELNAVYGIGSRANLLAWDGDSISGGYSALTALMHRETSPAYLLATNLGEEWEVHCRAVAGGNVTSGNALDRVSPAPDSVDSLIGTWHTGRKVCVIMVGTNDIVLGTANATIQSRLQTYCEARQAAGWEVIVGNIIPRSSFNGTQESNRVAINSWIQANFSSFADHFADFASAADWTAGSYGTYYQDGTHPNVAGVAILESVVRPIVL